MLNKHPKLAALALAIATVSANHAFAAPSIYPTGVTRYDPGKAYNSYVLFSGADRKTHLIDLNGNEVHQWANSGQPPLFLDPQLVNGQQGHVLLQFSGATGGGANNKEAQSIGEVDWDGKVVWQWGGAKAQDTYGASGNSNDSNGYGTAIRQHHDWRRLPNGNTVILINYEKQVKGFKAEKLLDDGIYEVDPKGQVVWKWHAYDHLNEFGFSKASLKYLHQTLGRGNDKTKPFDYLHFNNMSVVGPNKWFDAGDQRFHPDNLLIDSREANFIAIIDKKTGKVVWRIGPDFTPASFENKVPRPVDQISGQHDAHIIPKGLPGEGNLLVFDNQGEAGYPPVKLGVGGQLGSRVLEIDPIKKEIVWQYTGADSGRPNYAFYSSYISSARRLPNGNTLIDEGMNGRFLQVTAKGEIVWEYISPYFNQPRADDPQQISSNTVYRAQPVPYEWTPAGTPHAEKPVKAQDITQYRVPANP
ncbi:aryl-sulfate sulfotransferase [Methylomonas sp. MK1]|uniref:aryl-sulfate sulfotransferase n=1 Tax=Methylomonas sp. MK1 TaxID=1131552 RepID=UPI0003651789|nr:aryl-sulfate sulfotransferase [Methylomonas sp. MK1]